jgi:hypothetical protein
MKPIPVQRQLIEKERRKHKVRRGLFWWAKWENVTWFEKSTECLLKWTGYYDRGFNNLFDIRSNSPKSFCRTCLKPSTASASSGFRPAR